MRKIIPLIISVDEPEPDEQSPFLREEPVKKEIPVSPVSKIPKKDPAGGKSAGIGNQNGSGITCS